MSLPRYPHQGSLNPKAKTRKHSFCVVAEIRVVVLWGCRGSGYMGCLAAEFSVNKSLSTSFERSLRFQDPTCYAFLIWEFPKIGGTNIVPYINSRILVIRTPR